MTQKARRGISYLRGVILFFWMKFKFGTLVINIFYMREKNKYNYKIYGRKKFYYLKQFSKYVLQV